MSDKLQKYLERAKGGRRDQIIKVKSDGEHWSVRRLTTMEVRRAIELAMEEDGTPKETYNEIDVMIVKATEHEFDWNNAELLKAYNCVEKFELPPRLLDNPDDYAALSKAVRNFTDTKEALLKEGKISSEETPKQAG
ncbi:hypothetical protein TS65_02740 [Aneurinibacillus migulanus]|uniref:Phage XkdN-like tail assembly chaperone protein, TAC n=1 Tax=Aneurinibacillus migulanus TaxID=47500 RepID=A0A0D1Y5I0_ANEMI|nr:hypothetical protein [Aneurinibacillus migulanus]KIV59608.1 hypothetical protein TS65_02740 [Aneurinibacillus migulanus]KON93136.1 hypothetical protein AF333_26085 [Aneurinibacillus migulanus]MED4731663.1 hypothetical protein [Aneurinibacillus migulanus]SDK30637.1 Phage XkdN-like tail assembly chaperone protein, TAC [Aneurinibacillus migulanus]GED16422.1 hypothetical protein AMI01nite_44130 [Aneurinibacillus migulanus]